MNRLEIEPSHKKLSRFKNIASSNPSFKANSFSKILSKQFKDFI